VAVLALALSAGMAFANGGGGGGGPDCAGNANCGTVNNTTNNNTTNNQGGTGVGVGVGVAKANAAAAAAASATGGSVNHSGNSLNINANKAEGGNVNIGYGAIRGGEGGEGGRGGYAKQDQDQDQKQKQQQQQTQGNKQNVTFEDSGRADVNYSGTYTVKSAPAIALGGPASGPCNGFSGGVAGSGIGFGFAANASTVDIGCEDRETARMFHLLGDTKTGLEILKSSGAYLRMVEKKEAPAKKAAADAAEVARVADIRRKNPSSDGSWTSAHTQ
jgi:hypothetical protein